MMMMLMIMIRNMIDCVGCISLLWSHNKLGPDHQYHDRMIMIMIMNHDSWLWLGIWLIAQTAIVLCKVIIYWALPNNIIILFMSDDMIWWYGDDDDRLGTMTISSDLKLTEEREWPKTSMEPFFVSVKSWKKRSSLYLVTKMDRVPGIWYVG